MLKRVLLIGFVSFSVISGLGCASQPQPIVNCRPIWRGLAFLVNQYNPTVGLLRESPEVAPHKYWLTNDNALAACAFSKLGKPDMGQTLAASMQRYGFATNGLIEVVWGAPIAWPPHVERQVLISKIEQYEIWQEFHDSGPRFEDWQEYANLALLGALHEHQQGRAENARIIFKQALEQFDGIGFNDKARRSPSGHGYYETYKLALALYVGAKIAAPMDGRGVQLFTALLQKQAPLGGFTALYDGTAAVGDANTETTALALLALDAYGCVGR